MSDPLADAVRAFQDDGGGTCDGIRNCHSCLEDVLAAVRAHLAAVLDAEEAAWPGEFIVSAQGARAAVAKIRSALGAEPVAKEAEG